MKRIWDWLRGNSGAVESKGVSAGLLVMRVGSGLMMAFAHGWGKLSNFGELSGKFADPFGLGMTLSLSFTVLAEFFCALTVALGLFTRGTVIPLIITMATAAFIIHGDDPFGRKEKALLYVVIFLTLLLTGPGRYSLDQMFRRRR